MVFIDLDDTLISSSEGTSQAMEAVTDIICEGLDSEWRSHFKSAWERARARFWLNDANALAGRFDPGQARQVTLSAALRECNLEAADINEMMHVYESVKKAAVQLADGAFDLLQSLRERGATLVLVTNGTSREQRSKIAAHGLAGSFDAVLIEEEAGVGKPELYRHARGCGGPRQAYAGSVVIGDDLKRDGRGAELIGLHFLHVARQEPCSYCAVRSDAAHVVSLHQVGGHLESISIG